MRNSVTVIAVLDSGKHYARTLHLSEHWTSDHEVGETGQLRLVERAIANIAEWCSQEGPINKYLVITTDATSHGIEELNAKLDTRMLFGQKR